MNPTDLYQDAILDHGRHPHNRRVIAACSHQARNENPACGDEVAVFVKLDAAGVIRDIAFDGQCCGIAAASASLMTDVLLGKTAAQAGRLFERFLALTADAAAPAPDGFDDEWERLSVLSVVRDYPVRVTCATLAWHTMTAALAGPR
jgi:nitrogen fixation NifU-like protein